MLKKKEVQKIGKREVIYWMTYDDSGNEMHAREYVASMEIIAAKSGKKRTTFNVELPEWSLREIPFIGMFDNYRELECYISALAENGEEKLFVAQVATDRPNQYVVLNPTGEGQHLYYIMIET